ncbi:MAG: hypothetical protein ACOC7K_02005 [bacterium]
MTGSTGKEGEAGGWSYTSMQPDAVQSPPQLAINRPVVRERFLSWAEPRLEPADKQALLFCQTVLPREFSVMVHSEGKAEAFDADGTARGAVQGNAYHKKFGGHVVQVDPAARDTRTLKRQNAYSKQSALNSPRSSSRRYHFGGAKARSGWRRSGASRPRRLLT